jgi:PHD/YefM family antitoxin component YafN of YafNO toxin-antitoxin module
MKEITDTEFQSHFEQNRDAAVVEPVVITKDGKPHLVVISYEEYKNLRHKAGIQQSLHISELSEADFKAITESKVPAHLDYLNDELEDD